MTTGSRRRLQAGDVLQDEFGNALKLVEQLGEGGQGEVWSLLGGRAAVKVIKGSAAQDIDHLRTRLAAVRRFDLTGIPIARPLAALGEGRVGYVMELLAEMTGIGSLAKMPRGEALLDWHRRTGGLHRRLRLLGLTAEALTRLHARALAFGDLSPTNVLVSKDSGHDQVWLIDPDNLRVESSAQDAAVLTRGYGAPELVQARAGCSTLTDAFSFAVLAFQVLTLVHPFIGDPVYQDPGLEDDAFSGRLPWVDHSADGRNRTTMGLPRETILTGGLTQLFRQTFEEGLTDPLARPSLREWCSKLDQAAGTAIICPGCRASYYAAVPACPWCGAVRPLIARCDLHGFVPPQPGIPDLPRETDRLESLVLTTGEPLLLRARNGLICLEPGPGALAVDPVEPLVEITWRGTSSVLVRRIGRHGVELRDPTGQRSQAVRPGETRDIPLSSSGLWTVHLGDTERAHRFVRILFQRTEP